MNAPEITRVQIKEAGFTPTSPKIGGWLIVVAIGLILSLLQNLTFMLPALAPLGGGPTWVRLTDPKSPAFHPYWRSIGLVAMLTI